VTALDDERGLRDFDSLPDRIRLHRQADPRSVVVVEGCSDKRLLRTILSEADAVTFVGGTRATVLDVACSETVAGLDRIVCLVDRDFDDVVAEAIADGQPVVSYDGADLEDMLIGSPAAARLVEELGSAPKLAAFGQQHLLDRAREEAEKVARLRRANAINQWGLAFDKVDIPSKVDRASLALSVTGLCAALQQTASKNVTRSELEEVVTTGEIPVCRRSGRRLVSGQDQLSVIATALRGLIGSRTKSQSEPEFLAAALRASAMSDWLRDTNWFRELRTRAGLA
jgi:hypothetical protein